MDARALAAMERAPVPVPALTERGIALAALSGALATAALLLSPVGRGTEPMVLPLLPIDLRLVLLPAAFPLLHAGVARARWPFPVVLLPALAMVAAAMAHFQGSAVLNLVAGLPGSAPGDRVDLVPAFLSGGSLLVALAAAMDRASDRLLALARRLGIDGEPLRRLEALADREAARTLGFAGAAFTAFVLAAAAGDGWLGGEEAPLPEMLGALIAVGVAVLLFPGLTGRRPVVERWEPLPQPRAPAREPPG